jgi:putative transferase (TIGR04331 family)
VTIVWNAQRVSEGLSEIDSARPLVLANVKHLLDEFHGINYSPRYYDIILGDWVERYLHLVYVATQQYANGESNRQNSDEASTEITILPTSDTAEFFAAHQTLPDQMLAVLRCLSFSSIDAVKISDGEVKVKNSSTLSRRNKINAVLLKFASIGTNPKVLFVKPFSGSTPNSWVSAMFSWRKWAKQDDLDFSVVVQTKIDSQWRHKHIAKVSVGSDLSETANAVLSAFMPVCALEGFAEFKSRVKKARPKRFEHVYSAQALWTHFAFKVLAAEWCEQGTKLHYHQHGGWYGLDESHVGEIYESRVSDFYYTWGWSRGSTNTRALPPVMPNLRIQQKQFDSLICFDQPQQIYRLQYFPLPGTLQTMYDQTADFVRARESATELRIRLFPGEYGSQQKDAILRANSRAIIDNSQDIFSQYSSSRIVFHNYLGTSWLETLGNNIPTICFYDVDAYRFRSDAKAVLEDLVNVGILHISGLSAAEKAHAVESDIDSWWLSEEVQIARRNFVTQFANFSTDWKRIWRENFLDVLKVSESA